MLGGLIVIDFLHMESTKNQREVENRLRDTSGSTRVKVADGKTKVQDGPYADTKEQLGGYYLIDVKNLDEALSWAARCPGASHGIVEVRPVWEM